jgi:hypothetical protein
MIWKRWRKGYLDKAASIISKARQNTNPGRALKGDPNGRDFRAPKRENLRKHPVLHRPRRLLRVNARRRGHLIIRLEARDNCIETKIESKGVARAGVSFSL